MYGLISYFFRENFAGFTTPPAKVLVRRAGRNGYLLFTAGTGFVKEGFSLNSVVFLVTESGWAGLKPFLILLYQPLTFIKKILK